MCTDVVNARLNHKTAHTLEVTATKPKESIRNKSGKDATRPDINYAETERSDIEEQMSTRVISLFMSDYMVKQG